MLALDVLVTERGKIGSRCNRKKYRVDRIIRGNGCRCSTVQIGHLKKGFSAIHMHFCALFATVLSYGIQNHCQHCGSWLVKNFQ